MLNILALRQDFPLLRRKIGGKKLIYLDNAATTQKPEVVIKAVANYYRNSNANVHRGIHTLSEEATRKYEDARKKVAKFINARSPEEIIFVRNTTEALNLLAFTLKPEEVVVSVAEHHSNYLPWQKWAKKLRVVSVGERINGDFIAIAHASNVLGTINSLPRGRTVVVDGAQAVPHFKVDVQELGCDFYAFSAHKMFGPMGVGVLWGRRELLERMPPFMVGGGMISGQLPEKFEAGTPPVAEAIGLAEAIDYLENLGFEEIRNYERQITEKMLDELKKIPEVTLYGPEAAEERVPVFSFSLTGVHPHDAAQFLNDRYAIAVRAGQHCAGALHQHLGISATLRVSLAFYNTEEEIEIFVGALKQALRVLKYF